MKRFFLSLVPLMMAAGAAHAGALPDVGELPSQALVQIEGSRSEEVYNHFVSECEGVGKPMFLGTLRHGRYLRLTLLDRAEAASYVKTEGDGKYPWLLACQGRESFLLEKEHQYATGGAAFRLHKGRSLEGIDFVEKGPFVAAAQGAQADELAFAEKMASQLSSYGMDFVATKEGTRFEGRIDGRQGSCDKVWIRLLRPGEEAGSELEFNVCSGTVYPSGAALAMKKG